MAAPFGALCEEGQAAVHDHDVGGAHGPGPVCVAATGAPEGLGIPHTPVGDPACSPHCPSHWPGACATVGIPAGAATDMAHGASTDMAHSHGEPDSVATCASAARS